MHYTKPHQNIPKYNTVTYSTRHYHYSLYFPDPTTRGWIVTAVAKLTARIGTYVPEARGIIDRYRTGCPAELRQVGVYQG